MMVKKKQKRHAVTPAFKQFLKDADEIVECLSFLYHLVEQADKTVKVASKALLSVETDKGKLRQLRKSARLGGGAMKRYDKYRKLLREFVSVRLADSYLCYISDLLTILHENKIELLNIKTSISFEEIISFEKLEDLHGHLIEKRVIDLSYKGISDLNAELASKLNFSIFRNKTEKKQISDILEVRNLLVHNRGKINRRFLSKTDGDVKKLCKNVDLGDPVGNLRIVLLHAFRIDLAARKKFKIKQVSYVSDKIIKIWEEI